MAQTNRSAEQRLYHRYPLKDEIFLSIQGDARQSSCSLTDLSEGGAGCLSGDDKPALDDRFIRCDLISENDQVILRSLTARVIFCDTGQEQKNDPDPLRRYGLQFINLTPLQKRQLSMIARKYGHPAGENTLPCRASSLSLMVPWKENRA
jgi:c-di-GMP-binding flagellar brake protein YcgR